MSYIRINIDDYVSIDLDEIFEEIDDEDLLEEVESRGLLKGGASGGRRMPAQGLREELCEQFDLLSVTSPEDLLLHIKMELKK